MIYTKKVWKHRIDFKNAENFGVFEVFCVTLTLKITRTFPFLPNEIALSITGWIFWWKVIKIGDTYLLSGMIMFLLPFVLTKLILWTRVDVSMKILEYLKPHSTAFIIFFSQVIYSWLYWIFIILHLYLYLICAF